MPHSPTLTQAMRNAAALAVRGWSVTAPGTFDPPFLCEMLDSIGEDACVTRGPANISSGSSIDPFLGR